MHPNAFLRTFWRNELRPIVFVAMSFDDRYFARFERVFAPAAESVVVDGVSLKAIRVDITQSGDSILTQILDRIAHSKFILADVSAVGRDSVTGKPYRNANVLYEVGLALACRQPSEVLLVKDDREQTLFDVSVVPQLQIDFSDEAAAVAQLTGEISARLANVQYFDDARLALAVRTMSSHEMSFVLRIFNQFPQDGPIWLSKNEIFSSTMISRLLDKGLLRVLAVAHDSSQSVYEWTDLGREVIRLIQAFPRAQIKEN